VAIGANKDPKVIEVAERLHDLGEAAGYWRHILYDDRDESPGVKFTDAELLGMPWILTVSPRSLAAGGVEVTNRATGERSTRSIDEVEALIRGDADPVSVEPAASPR
jgi:prolyl-tRNA synthetase